MSDYDLPKFFNLFKNIVEDVYSFDDGLCRPLATTKEGKPIHLTSDESCKTKEMFGKVCNNLLSVMDQNLLLVKLPKTHILIDIDIRNDLKGSERNLALELKHLIGESILDKCRFSKSKGLGYHIVIKPHPDYCQSNKICCNKNGAALIEWKTGNQHVAEKSLYKDNFVLDRDPIRYTEIQQLTKEETEHLFNVIKSFNEHTETASTKRKLPTCSNENSESFYKEDSIELCFAKSISPAEILEEHGWSYVGSGWNKPGSSDRDSNGSILPSTCGRYEVFVNFSPNVYFDSDRTRPMETEPRVYSSYDLFCHYNANGDYSKASMMIAEDRHLCKTINWENDGLSIEDLFENDPIPEFKKPEPKEVVELSWRGAKYNFASKNCKFKGWGTIPFAKHYAETHLSTQINGETRLLAKVIDKTDIVIWDKSKWTRRNLQDDFITTEVSPTENFNLPKDSKIGADENNKFADCLVQVLTGKKAGLESRVNPESLITIQSIDGKIKHKNFIVAQNGWLEIDINTGTSKLNQFSSDFFVPWEGGFIYKPQMDRSWAWQSILNWAGGDEAGARRIAEMAGLTLTKLFIDEKSSREKILYVQGRKGSGKSTFVNLLESIIGAANIGAINAPQLANHGFGLESIYNKHWLVGSEWQWSLKDSEYNNRIVNLFKVMTTGLDSFSIPRKYKSSIDVKMNCNIILHSNPLPNMFSDDGGAFLSRMQCLPFGTIQSPEKYYTEQLEANKSAFIDIFIEHACSAIRRGSLTEWELEAKMRSDIQDRANPLSAFVRECCVLDPTTRISSTELNNAITQWCLLNPEEVNVQLTPRLVKRFITDGTWKVEQVKSSGVMHYRGLRLNNVGLSLLAANACYNQAGVESQISRILGE